MESRRFLPVLLLVIALVVVQLLVSVAGSGFYLTQLTMAAYYSLVVIGLSVLMGYAGQISIGHAAFFAIGGYTSAVLTTTNLQPHLQSPLVSLLRTLGMTASTTDIYGNTLLHVAPWAALLAAVLLTALVAFLIGMPILKLKGHYLAMATLGFGVIVYRIVLGTRLFGEADGISNIPPFTLPFGLAVSSDSAARVANYYIAAFVVVLGMMLLINLIHSRVGRALRAIHGSEPAAAAAGVDTARYKLAIFVLSAVFACVGGVLLTHYNGGIGPAEAGVMKSVRYVSIVAVGGMANIWGALSMGVLLNFLSLRGVFGSYDDAFFGIILIVIMLFFPGGILQSVDWGRVRRRLPFFRKDGSAP